MTTTTKTRTVMAQVELQTDMSLPALKKYIVDMLTDQYITVRQVSVSVAQPVKQPKGGVKR